MLKLIVPLACICFLGACNRDQTRQDRAPTHDLKLAAGATPDVRTSKPGQSGNELLALENAYSQALIKKDRQFLMNYYAPEWRGGNWLGFWTKSTMLKAVLDERYVVRSSRLSRLNVRVFGTVGMVQGISDEVSTVDGNDTSGKWSFTDVFVFRNGQWLAIASHTSEVKRRS